LNSRFPYVPGITADLYEAKTFDGATLRAVAEELFSVADLD
jgi:hypothetical protein